MKKLVMVLLLALVALSLTACAQWGNSGRSQTKCPACGYEFETPALP